MNTLSIQNITKRYRDVVAVDHVSFDVDQGSVFGLLGPNGAGKTSLIRIITTIAASDEGTIYFRGEPLSGAHASKMGYLPEERGLYKKMKVGEHLIYLARLKGLTKKDAKERIGAMMERFDISDWWSKKVEDLSKGMQQKIQFIATIVHQPSLIILDEPFSGLDPINANLIRSEIDELNRAGVTVIFSTHRMEQVEQICKEIVLINEGRNVLQGEVEHIRDEYKEGIFRIAMDGQLHPGNNHPFSLLSQNNKTIRIKAKDHVGPNDILRILLKEGHTIRRFEEERPGLNEVFIKVVNESANE